MSRYTHKKLYTKKYKQFIFNTEDSIRLEKSNKAISWGGRGRAQVIQRLPQTHEKKQQERAKKHK